MSLSRAAILSANLYSTDSTTASPPGCFVRRIFTPTIACRTS